MIFSRYFERARNITDEQIDVWIKFFELKNQNSREEGETQFENKIHKIHPLFRFFSYNPRPTHFGALCGLKFQEKAAFLLTSFLGRTPKTPRGQNADLFNVKARRT